jgi:hypothetical protein
MDTNVLSCSKCGHTVSETAEACAYCGTAVSSGDAPPAPDQETPGIAAQAVEPPLMPEDESASKTEIPDVAAGAELSSQIQPEEKQADIVEPATESISGLDDQLADVDDQIDFQLPDDELVMELDTEETAKEPEAAAGQEPESIATSEPALISDPPSDLDDIVDLEQHAAEATAEVIPLADKVSAKTASDDSPGLPETPVLEVSGEDTPESETLGADILELVQDEASEQESAEKQASETVKTLDQPTDEKTAESSPEETPDSSENNDDDLEAILLAPADEDQPLKQPLSGDVEDAVETGASEDPVELAAEAVGAATKSGGSSEVIQKLAEGQASVEALKIEKASKELAEAQKKQKVVTDAKELKKQKAALVKAKAIRIKKLKLAKAQALKKKKLKLAKVKALKKQKAARAGIETANKEVAAGSKSPEADNSNRVIQRMDTNTKMLGLLKKYEGQAIGINYDNSAAIKEAQLVEANDEFFSVFVKDKELNYSHPLKTILTIIEGKDGVETGDSDQKEKFKAVVKVYPLVLF